MGGEDLKLTDNREIMSIQSPKTSVGGPYAVVYKDIEDRWAIVALDWDTSPSLGIRWFWGNSGNPISTGHPTWFIIPSPLIKSILDGLTIPYEIRSLIDKFLCHEISGDDLEKKIKLK